MSSELRVILKRLELEELASLFAAHEIEDEVLRDLTDDDLERLGIDKLGPRKKLLAAFAELAPPPMDPADRVAPAPVASREHPFVNSLGLPFVPLPGSKTLFAAWTARVADYQCYCDERHLSFPDCEFAQTANDPVVNVSWREAVAFSEWLTHRERVTGALSRGFGYRLPTDREWSLAVGLSDEIGRTPAERSGSVKGYPWGSDEFPPPVNVGNYHWSLGRDPFRETSPVGSFPANALGIHDLGGNVWEWCMDEYDREGDEKVQRGASCFNDDDEYLLSSYRDRKWPDHRRNNTGFRLVLAPVGQDPWF